MNEISDHFHFALLHASRCDGGGAHSEPTGRHCGFVTRHSVLVARDVHKLKHFLCTRAVESLPAQISEHQVIVGASADKLEIAGNKLRRKCFAVDDGLNGVLFEIFALRLVQGDGERGNGVVVRASLQAWEDCPVDLVTVIDDFTLCIGPLQGLTLS